MRCDALILGAALQAASSSWTVACAGWNLLVADASAPPTIPRARPHLTTLAVAEKLAETI